jgi:hypothetical protein
VASNLNNPEGNSINEKLKLDFAKTSDSKQIQTDGLRLLIITTALYGSICYLAIGLSILLAICFFWEIIKKGKRQLVTR